MASNLPSGFVLDEDETGLPQGFVLDQYPISGEARARGGSTQGQELRAPAGATAENGNPSLMDRLYSGLREFGQGAASALPDWSGQPLTRGPGTPERIAAGGEAARVQGTGEATRLNTPAADWGRTSMENLEINAATGGAAMMVPPPVKGAAFAGVRGLISDVGQAWAKRPFQEIVETVMGSGGQVAGEGTDDPAAGVAGYLLAAKGGEGVAKIAQGAGRLGIKVGKGIAETVMDPLGRKKVPPAPNTFLNVKADPLAPIPAARDRVEREISVMESDMNKIIGAVEPRVSKRPGQVPSALSVPEAEARFYPMLKAGKARAQAIENNLWTASLSSKGISPSLFQTQVRLLQDGLNSHDVRSAIPDADIAEILDWKGFVSPRQIQAKISELGQKESAIWQDSTYRGNKLNFSRNMESLRDILLTSLESSVRDPAKLAEAKAFTAARKEFYTKGPIWEALTTGKLGTIKAKNPASGKDVEIPFYDKGPGQTIAGFQGGAEQVKQAEVLSGYGGAKVLPLSAEFENVVKAEFASASRSPDGKVDEKLAQQWMKANRPRIAKTHKLANDLDNALQSLETVADRRQRMVKSAYAKYAGSNSDKSDVNATVRLMFSSPDKVKMSRDLRTTFDTARTKDPHVLEAYQYEVITQLFARNSEEFQAVKKMLDDDPNVRAVINDTFRGQPEKLQIFDRILAAGVRFEEAASKGTLAQTASKAAIFVGGLAGATLGRMLATGTIQVPAYMAKGFRGTVARALGRVIKDPATVVNLAMVDPKMAQWLLSKYAPNSDTGALRTALITARRMNTAITQSLQNSDLDLRKKYGIDDPEH